MRLVALAVLLATTLSSCGNQSDPIATAQTPLPTLSPAPAAPGGKTMTINVRLSTPDELKVREGDVVTAGQVIADRSRDRAKLQAQREQLGLQLAKLSEPIIPPNPLRPAPMLAQLPAPTFVEEIAAIEQAKVNTAKQQEKFNIQQRKLDLLGTMTGELPPATIPHEAAQLAKLQREVDQAQAEERLAEARLSQAKSARQYVEYQHQLKVSEQAISLNQQDIQRESQQQEYQQQKREREFQIAEVQAKLQALEQLLQELSEVRSPRSGKVRRIKWVNQSDRNLNAEVVLSADSVASDRQPPPVLPVLKVPASSSKAKLPPSPALPEPQSAEPQETASDGADNGDKLIGI